MARVRIRSRTLSSCSASSLLSTGRTGPTQMDGCQVCDLICLACTRIQNMRLEQDDIHSICNDIDSVCISESLNNLNYNVREICIKLKQLSTLEMSELIDRLSVTFNGALIHSPEQNDCDTLTEMIQKLNMDSSTGIMTDCIGSLEDLTMESSSSEKYLMDTDVETVCSLLYYLMAQQKPQGRMIESFMQRLTIL